MREIRHFEFMCDIDYLQEFKKKTSRGSIFIYDIRGIDCKHLIVRYFCVFHDIFQFH
jgi:hypothetical protein